MFDIFPPIWNGTLREHYLMLFGAAAGIAIVSGFISAWLGAHFGGSWAAKRALRKAREQQLTHPVAEELARLGQAVDAIALEVERISEGQRFTARLLSTRVGAEPPPPSRDPGYITPH